VRFVGLCATIATVAATTTSLGGVASAASSCLRPVDGGVPGERAAIQRILCLMPGTAIEGVQILPAPPDASADAVALALTIDLPVGPAAETVLAEARARWEGDVAAGAIRDGFLRLGLAHVVAYEELSPGTQVDSSHFVGIARLEWGAGRWTVGAAPRSLGRGAGTWLQLQTRLDVLSRRFHVRTRLERYNPFGKTPVVTVMTGRGGEFIDRGGFQAYERALRFSEARYDGVLLQLVTPTGEGLQVFTVDRGRRSSGCSRSGVIPHRRYEICPSD
jgi:hypothetical protein